jgi:hypothetical protein
MTSTHRRPLLLPQSLSYILPDLPHPPLVYHVDVPWAGTARRK